MSELMEVANRFADEEDAYNNKRGHSLEVDRASRQRRKYRNGDSHARRNQIAAGYERRDEEGYENREFQASLKSRSRKTKVLWPIGGGHALRTLSNPLCVPRWEESF
jgi:hypothetical protein